MTVMEQIIEESNETQSHETGRQNNNENNKEKKNKKLDKVLDISDAQIVSIKDETADMFEEIEKSLEISKSIDQTKLDLEDTHTKVNLIPVAITPPTSNHSKNSHSNK